MYSHFENQFYKVKLLDIECAEEASGLDHI